jgi:hypothetical protein
VLWQIHVYNFPQDHNVKIDLVKGVKGDVSEVTTIKGFQVSHHSHEVPQTPAIHDRAR